MSGRPEQLLRHVRRLLGRAAAGPDGDAALLARFVRQQDETAFAALVERHGPMVLAVCRRLLRNAHDAEDALQATFLVLARKAAQIRRPETLTAWLHGTARRLALKCRQTNSRRQQWEARSLQIAPDRPAPDLLQELTARELLLIFDEELQRLPEVYRLPLILCALEGRTQEDAARVLGWTPGSVKGRLERGRARLHARLVRRGLAPAAALATAETAQTLAAALPVELAAMAVRVALQGLAVGAEIVVPARVRILAEGALQVMGSGKRTVGFLVLLGGVVVGLGLAAHQFLTASPSGAKDGERRTSGKGAPPERGAVGEPKKKSPQDFEGIWRVVAYRVDGEPAPPDFLKPLRVTFRGKSLTFEPEPLLERGKGNKTLFKVGDPKGRTFPYRLGPKWPNEAKGWPSLIYKWKNEAASGETRGIYRFHGPRLELHFGALPLEPFKGQGQLWVLERLPPAGKGDAAPGKGAGQEDEKRLQGTWLRLVHGSSGLTAPGKPYEPSEWTFKGKTVRFGYYVSLRDLDETRYGGSADVTLEPGKRPGQLDLAVSGGKLGKRILRGIYLVEGDVLVVALNEDGKRRPTEFTNDPEAGQRLLTFRRRRGKGRDRD